MSTQTTAATPDEIFQTALFGPMAMPWKTVFLEPDPLTAFAQRPARGATSVGELYHENSKLYPQHPAVARGTAGGREARADFVRKRAAAAAAAGDDEPPAGAPAAVRALLHAWGRRAPDDAWYALEARLACAGALYAWEPRTGRVRHVRRLAAGDWARLDHAAAPAGAGPRPSSGAAVVALLGSFARGEVLLGSRGYRRTVLDAGRVAAELEAAAREAGVPVHAAYEFYDREVDRLLEIDGTELGTLALFTVGGGDDAHCQG